MGREPLNAAIGELWHAIHALQEAKRELTNDVLQLQKEHVSMAKAILELAKEDERTLNLVKKVINGESLNAEDFF